MNELPIPMTVDDFTSEWLTGALRAGGALEDERVTEVGSNTGRLSDMQRDYDPIAGIPVMSAIPVNVRRVADPAP